MKLITMILTLSAALAFGEPTVLVDQTFKTTFSDYGQLEKLLTCTPGYKGGFPTADTLQLKSHAIELGFEIPAETFRAISRDAVDQEGAHTGPAVKRPYDEGCRPAMEKFRKAIAQEVVEVEVHRRLTESKSITHRVNRKRDGEVNSVKYIESDVRTEMFKVVIAGFEFTLFRTLSGNSREL